MTPNATDLEREARQYHIRARMHVYYYEDERHRLEARSFWLNVFVALCGSATFLTALGQLGLDASWTRSTTAALAFVVAITSVYLSVARYSERIALVSFLQAEYTRHLQAFRRLRERASVDQAPALDAAIAAYEETERSEARRYGAPAPRALDDAFQRALQAEGYDDEEVAAVMANQPLPELAA